MAFARCLPSGASRAATDLVFARTYQIARQHRHNSLAYHLRRAPLPGTVRIYEGAIRVVGGVHPRTPRARCEPRCQELGAVGSRLSVKTMTSVAEWCGLGAARSRTADQAECSDGSSLCRPSKRAINRLKRKTRPKLKFGRVRSEVNTVSYSRAPQRKAITRCRSTLQRKVRCAGFTVIRWRCLRCGRESSRSTKKKRQ